MYIELGFRRIKTTNIDGVEYVRLEDVKDIAQTAFIDCVVDVTRDAFSNVNLLCDSKTGVVTCVNDKSTSEV